jgi:hypothetical protein
MTDAFRAESKLPELIAHPRGREGARLPAPRRHDGRALRGDGRRRQGHRDVQEGLWAIDRKAHRHARAASSTCSRPRASSRPRSRSTRQLIKAAPNNPDFVFELCETLIQRGDRPKALKLLTGAGDAPPATPRSSRRWPTSTSASRRRKASRSCKSSRTRRRRRTRPRHRSRRSLLPGGRQEEGARDLGRSRSLIPNKARAAAYELGEVYLDHDMTEEALASLREATTARSGQRPLQEGAGHRARADGPSGTATRGRSLLRGPVRIWEDLLSGAPKTDKCPRARLRARTSSASGPQTRSCRTGSPA